MRRLIAVAALCATTLLTGCSDGTVTAKPATAPSAAPSVETSPSRDPAASAICDDLHQHVLDVDTKAFGAELGRMVAARTQSDKAEETRAQQAATAKLNEIAGKLRAHVNEATQARLKNALSASASNLESLAGDAGLARLNSLDAVGETTRKFATALGDIADYCSA
jgi:hypothetical protein